MASFFPGPVFRRASNPSIALAWTGSCLLALTGGQLRVAAGLV